MEINYAFNFMTNLQSASCKNQTRHPA